MGVLEIAISAYVAFFILFGTPANENEKQAKSKDVIEHKVEQDVNNRVTIIIPKKVKGWDI